MTNTEKAAAREYLRNAGWTQENREVVGKKMEWWYPPAGVVEGKPLPYSLESALYTQQQVDGIQKEKKNRKKKGK